MRETSSRAGTQVEAGASPNHGKLPNLLIIGAAKSGTTSLHEYLDLHPSVAMSTPKELKFFNQEDWGDKLDWYRRHFRPDAPVRGESSPAYTMHPWIPGVPERIKQIIPNARLIYLVRDPVERLVAQYVEFFAMYLEHRSFSEALADYDKPSNRYVMASRYAYQLDRYREHFPDERILVLDQRELLDARDVTLRRVFAFVGVDPDYTTPAFKVRHNERAQKVRANSRGLWMRRRGLLEPARQVTRPLPTALRERLKRVVADPVASPDLDARLRGELEDVLREDARRLREYTGKALDHWSV